MGPGTFRPGDTHTHAVAAAVAAEVVVGVGAGTETETEIGNAVKGVVRAGDAVIASVLPVPPRLNVIRWNAAP